MLTATAMKEKRHFYADLTTPLSQREMCKTVWEFCQRKNKNNPIEVLQAFTDYTLSSKLSAGIVMCVYDYENEKNCKGIEKEELRQKIHTQTGESFDRIDYKLEWI